MTIKTFTPETIAVIANDSDRIPSANDLFVRYEDHMSAIMAASPSAAAIFRLPSAVNDEADPAHRPVSADSLRDSGYTHFDRKGGIRSGESGFVALWQKSVRDPLGTRYFVNITEYDFSSYTGKSEASRFEAEVQFTFPDKEFSNVSHSVRGHSVRSVEDYFAMLWNTELYVHYETVDTDNGDEA